MHSTRFLSSLLSPRLSSLMRKQPISTTTTTSGTSRLIGDGVRGPRRPFRVCVEGNIGSGKTRFLQHLATMDTQSALMDIVSEPVDEWRNVDGANLLHLMYTDPKKYSFLFQTFVQLSLLRLHTQVVEKSSKSLVLMERSLFSARYCFVENLFNSAKMSASEFAVLKAWFDFIVSNVDVNVDLIVYLRTQPHVALERLRRRERCEETDSHGLDLHYLQQLHQLHEQWLYHKTAFQPLPAPVLVVEADEDVEKLMGHYDSLRDEIIKRATN